MSMTELGTKKHTSLRPARGDRLVSAHNDENGGLRKATKKSERRTIAFTERPTFPIASLL